MLKVPDFIIQVLNVECEYILNPQLLVLILFFCLHFIKMLYLFKTDVTRQFLLILLRNVFC